ncbi:hypothetical protein [Polaromonas eurypsychrophila]|uniref:Uncharacterized protein n=1 Tax=Polaromonas eurypsychrophila TaxID=1614635 RepID=A0A916SRQ3_9BURK|nr:hypothetical protein [Polaromonas eurypsychrophila]GGB10036.1 hypothetical protein GCM10011496_33720 [Polaromonas eurypsychrophila]
MNAMKFPAVAPRLLQVAIFSAVMYATIQIALSLGVERKSWLQLSWEFLAGGSFGAMAGMAFFILFGAIGWVCGALYGSIGLWMLMIGGGLGGLGLGALANIIRNPQRYTFHWPTILAVAAVGILLALILSSLAFRIAVRAPSASVRATDA